MKATKLTPGMWVLAALLPALTGCITVRSKAPADWLAWQPKRHESVAGTNGWSTLVGLHWLDGERLTVGSHPTNQAVLPAGRAPARVGVFVRDGRDVLFEAAPDAVVTVSGERVQRVELRSDIEEAPTPLKVGSLTLILIARGEHGERLGVRVRDPEAPARLHFQGLQYFPYDPAWRLEGRFEAHPEAGKLRVPDVTGNTQALDHPGVLVFTARGREYRLEATREIGDERFFVIFRDRTAGDTTYGAGRFLYVDPPDAAGRVVIDFNRAYSPPCAFTPYATCPLPPPQNRLPLAIRAGERKPPGSH